MSQHLDPHHTQVRTKLRAVGPLVVIVGGIFTIIGFASFFSSFVQFEGPPRYFWCLFIGLPLIAIGLAICKFAYLGSVTRFMANEVAPVGKDMANYMAEGTKGAVRTMASAVGEGLRSGDAGRCPKCQSPNDSDATFCKSCGAALAKTCPKCQTANDADSRFCDKCGQSIANAAT